MMGIRPLRSEADLAAVLGAKARASEILHRKRHLMLDQMWKLHTQWRLPTEALVRPYPLERKSSAASAA